MVGQGLCGQYLGMRLDQGFRGTAIQRVGMPGVRRDRELPLISW
jgi:hypothetical protein